MKKIFIAIMLLGSSAFAGDGGFSSVSCVSGSGRTVLSVFNDNYSGSAAPTTIRLIIDGQMLEYKSSGEVYNVKTQQGEAADANAPQVTWDEKGVTVVQAGDQVLKLNLALKYQNASYKASVQAGYVDPRAETELKYYISSNDQIDLSCKEYYQSP